MPLRKSGKTVGSGRPAELLTSWDFLASVLAAGKKLVDIFNVSKG